MHRSRRTPGERGTVHGHAAAALYEPGHSVHDQGEYALCYLLGLAGSISQDSIARRHCSCEGGDDLRDQLARITRAGLVVSERGRPDDPADRRTALRLRLHLHDQAQQPALLSRYISIISSVSVMNWNVS